VLGAGTGAVVVVVAAAMKACGAVDPADGVKVTGSGAPGASIPGSDTVDAAGPVMSAAGSVGVLESGSVAELSLLEFVSCVSVGDGAEYPVVEPLVSGSVLVQIEVSEAAGSVAGACSVAGSGGVVLVVSGSVEDCSVLVAGADASGVSMVSDESGESGATVPVSLEESVESPEESGESEDVPEESEDVPEVSEEVSEALELGASDAPLPADESPPEELSVSEDCEEVESPDELVSSAAA